MRDLYIHIISSQVSSLHSIVVKALAVLFQFLISSQMRFAQQTSLLPLHIVIAIYLQPDHIQTYLRARHLQFLILLKIFIRQSLQNIYLSSLLSSTFATSRLISALRNSTTLQRRPMYLAARVLVLHGA